jgi:hypothetical protein
MKQEQHENSVKEAASSPPEVGGWDPFQIWRTRVREPQLRAQSTARSAALASALALKKTA